jgi:pilus assembly protein CpaC
VNFISTGAANTIGTVTTGQFGGFGQQTINQNGVTNESINNVLNLFVFRPDINFGAVIEALHTKNLLQILAEPNLIAVNGKEASFLAGGQFPFPIVQPGAGFTAVTISFKEFGVRLQFTPVITPNGNIHLKVAPEVSTLDFANALSISGFTVPALSTRKAETEFEVQDGQSFVIAGLMDNRVTDVYNKIPGLGDIPILGNFFRSKSQQKSNSELMVLCTVRRVNPSSEPVAGPKDPKSFLEKDRFDKHDK